MRVVLAVPHRDLRLALELFLAEAPGVFVVGLATDAGSARALLAATRPDLLLLTWDLDECRASAFTREVLAAGWAAQIIQVCRDEEDVADALAAGATATVTSWDPPGRLRDALAAAAERAAA